MSIAVGKYIDAAPEEVFRRASDFARAPEIISGIRTVEMLTPGPVGKGTRFRETRVIFKREATEEMTVTAFEPPRRYCLEADAHGCRYRTEIRFVPRGEGTNVEMAFDAVPYTAWAKVLSFVFRPLMKQVAKDCAKDLDDLKAAVEGAPVTS